MPKLFLVAVSALLLVLAAATAQAAEQWYIVQLQGQPTGWMVQRETVKGDRINTSSQMQITVKRGPTQIVIEVESKFLETAKGEPLAALSKMDMSMFSQTVQWRFTDEGIEIKQSSAAGENTRTQSPIPGQWLTPAAAARYIEAQIEQGAKKIEYRTVDPLTGTEPYTTTMVLDGQENVEVLGRVVPATKVKLSVSNAPGIESVAYVNQRGWPLKATTNVGGMSMTMIATDKDLAMADRKPAELMNATLIKPTGTIKDPRTLKKATYTITSKTKLPDMPTTSVQHVKRIDANTLSVTVDLTRPTDQAGAPAVAVQHSNMIDGRDKHVKALHAKATKDVGEPKSVRAEAMRRFVYDYIDKKDLSVGFASASEVAQTGQGDCTEHGVLLAAMLRADGIPSRVASGLIYVDQAMGHRKIFGYHMWAQAWVDGKWVDLDATLPDATPFDATHITMAQSPMADGKWTNDFVKMAPMIGGLSIKVEP